MTGSKKGDGINKIHRHYYELAVFYVISGDINCSDAYVSDSFIYDDHNKQFISWDDFYKNINDYCHITRLPSDRNEVISYLQNKLRQTAKKVDENYHNNPHLSIKKGKPVLKKITCKNTASRT